MRLVVISLAVCCCGQAVAETSEISESPLTTADRSHWSFRRLQRPRPPEVQARHWVRNPIDRFVLARLEQAGLAPAPPASRALLIRRLYLDLLGLPPRPEEIAAFVHDPGHRAYERLVDRVLASPHYGERWAQIWLDLARFAETDGFEHDQYRAHAWKYRDWVIQALNDDLPYDQFLRLQLAGDEIRPGDAAAALATSFCLAGPDMPDINSQEERRSSLLNDITATVGSAILGLQIGCAQCHDHKYDPISQADFYRLRAIFAPAVHVERNKSVTWLGEDGTAEESFLLIRGEWNRRGPQVAPDFPRIVNLHGEHPPRNANGPTTGRRAALADWLTQEDHPLTARVIANRVWQSHFKHGLSRTPNDFGRLGDPPSHPQLLDWLASELTKQNWSLKQLHRLIVTSATYCQASHLRLAAGRPVRQAAEQRFRLAREQDPENRLLARFPVRRLEAEVLRDRMLASVGVLNLQMGGRSVMPPLPSELKHALSNKQWQAPENEADHFRRSIYVMARRNHRFPFFEIFDRPAALASCPRRNTSTTAPQSLLMINSEIALQAARRLAGSLAHASPSDRPEQVRALFLRTLCREAGRQEVEAAVSFLVQQRALLLDEDEPVLDASLPVPMPHDTDPAAAAALTDLCLAVLNTTEFLYLD